MKLNCKVNFEDNKRYIKVFVEELGDSTHTKEEEIDILHNYNDKIRYKDLNFKGYYKKDGNKIIKATDEADGDLVTLNLIDSVIEVKENLETEFSIETKQIKESEIGTHLTTADEVAEAKIWLFYDTIYEAIKDKVTKMKVKETDFEDKDKSRVTEEF